MGNLENQAVPDARRQPQQPQKRGRVIVAVALAALLWFSWTTFDTERAANSIPGPVVHQVNYDGGITDWDSIVPSEDLHWVPCFRSVDEFFCARLTVPLDYNRPLDASNSLARPNPTVHIALIMLPGRNHTESAAWSESPLLLNPGGPGGSGTSLVLLAGRAHQEIAGSDLDIIGFDPRGIGATTPIADCFSDMSGDVESLSPFERRASKEGSLLRRVLWMAENAVVGLPNTSSTATDQVIFRQRGLTKSCNTQDFPESILRYAGTPNVAQDMLSIVSAWDKWTSGLQPKQPPAVPSVSSEDAVPSGPAEAKAAPRESQPPSTRGKLVYWGFSYGTILGATFAAMFPEHVGRVVLDGVVNSDEWYFENSWRNAPQDMDKVIAQFGLYCFQAEKRCHLYREGDKPADVQNRFSAVLDSLIEQPRVYAVKGSSPVYLTYSAVKAGLFAATYVPAVFPSLAAIIDALYRGLDLSSFMQPVDLSPLCEPKPKDVWVKYPDDGGTAVLCSDQRFKLNTTRSELDRELRKMTEVSSFGDVAFTIASRCVGWDVDHVDPPAMDWNKFPLKDNDPVNTSFPILFISNTRDPITPIRSGLQQSRKFVNAGFIEQVGEGHCSSSMVSVCTMRKINSYFSMGIVPDKPHFDESNTIDGSLSGNWTKCEVDQRPWGVPGLHFQSGGNYAAQDAVLLQAGAHVRDTFKHWVHFAPETHAFERLFGMEESEVEALLANAKVL